MTKKKINELICCIDKNAAIEIIVRNKQPLPKKHRFEFKSEKEFISYLNTLCSQELAKIIHYWYL